MSCWYITPEEEEPMDKVSLLVRFDLWNRIMNEKNSNTRSSPSAPIENVCMTEEINDNEEMLFELDECLHNKTASLNELKEQVTNLENDIKRYTTPFSVQKSDLYSDISMFRTIASKYVKKELVDFYVDRMRKSADNVLNKEDQESTISALCQSVSKTDSSKN